MLFFCQVPGGLGQDVRPADQRADGDRGHVVPLEQRALADHGGRVRAPARSQRPGRPSLAHRTLINLVH